MRLHRLAPAALAVLAAGCIEDRLSVDVTTYVQANGSCTRRIEYRLERVDSEKGVALEIPASDDPLRLWHRFPRDPRWSVSDEASARLHLVTAEASLLSANEIDWDYWRQRAKQTPAARNHVSFAMSAEGPATTYDWSEVFLDPASPLAGVRFLAQALSKRENAFADRVVASLGPQAPRRADVKRAYRDSFALPFSRAVERLAVRPIYGPRERKEIEDLFDQLDGLHKDLVQAIVAASASTAVDDMTRRIEDAEQEWGDELAAELAQAGLPPSFELKEPIPKLRFRVKLVMPAAITRANTCFQGDTAFWEFDQDDLYGRGFEMWAKAGGR